MIFPEVTRRPDGTVAVDGILPLLVASLIEVPELLEKPEGPVRRRLFPEPSDEKRQRAEWARLVHPDLFALLASAREIVERDLKGLEPGASFQGIPRWRLEIPPQHVNAWISALNAARLALGALNGIESEVDLHPDLIAKGEKIEIDERTLAVIKINVLAELQQLLILDGLPEGERPRAPEEEGPGGEEDEAP
jgi:hypothetical protein